VAHGRAPRHQHGTSTRWVGEIVLVATEDAGLRRSLCQALATQGCRAVEADPSASAGELLARIQPVLILLDLDRSDGAGLDLLVELRDAANLTPVIALSTRGGEGDKVTALDLGADDYLTRPFGTSELLARIRVAMRRTRAQVASSEIVEVGPIRIDHSRYRVTVGGELVHLTPIEFRLLALLAKHAGKVISRDQLLHEVWGPNTNEAHYLRVHVATLRQKIEEDPAHPRWLVTVTGMGYRLCDE
jgi:two-component system KDP operon response regulator KdpE